ncbi:helix-turn-helix domain-containing protein [Streptomyces rubiginosohelvolus]|uniref:helix-turn-helix domain-containing protein n=1 Tax=Streptomyces rubiginosohelvolus TaxID=67362 RepID=UPI0036F9ED81
MFDGKALREARAAARDGRGLSASALADAVSATKSQILAYENGRYSPDPQRIKELAAALGVTPLDLADDTNRDNWTLADLRRANGLRAVDMANILQVSAAAYRKLESQGLTPARASALALSVASYLNISLAALEQHLANVPAVQTRRTHTAQLLRLLHETYVQPGTVDLPDKDHPLITELAGLYARPASTISPIVQYELAALRRARRKIASIQAVANYGATALEQENAQNDVRSEQARVADALRALPARLDAFLKSVLPSDVWRALAVLNAFSTFGLWLSPSQMLETRPVLSAIPDQLVVRSRELQQARHVDADSNPQGAAPVIRLAPGDPAYQVSPEGALYCTTYRPWYDALYPSVASFLQERENQLAGYVSGADLRKYFAQAHSVLFSFDGLLCRLFASNLHSVSDSLAHEARLLHLTTNADTPTDPVAMLRALVRSGSPTQIRRLDHLLTVHETKAARRAEPLPGVQQLFHVLTAGTWRLGVVTDHSGEAVETFLSHLKPVFDQRRMNVFGRPADPRLMKPNPHGVVLASAALGADRKQTILLGESVADALAAQAAGVLFIGVAPSQRQARMLRQAGATITVGSLREVTSVVRSLAPRRWTEPPHPPLT